MAGDGTGPIEALELEKEKALSVLEFKICIQY